MKEKIKLSDISEGYNHEEYIDKLYSWVADKQINFDAEKGYIDYEVIIQRNSDDKFFKYTYTQFGYNGDDILDQVATEVQEKQRIEYYYE